MIEQHFLMTDSSFHLYLIRRPHLLTFSATFEYSGFIGFFAKKTEGNFWDQDNLLWNTIEQWWQHFRIIFFIVNNKGPKYLEDEVYLFGIFSLTHPTIDCHDEIILMVMMRYKRKLISYGKDYRFLSVRKEQTEWKGPQRYPKRKYPSH